MKKTGSRWLMVLSCSCFVAGAGFIAGNAEATNGYFAHGYSIESKALGGAGAAMPRALWMHQ